MSIFEMIVAEAKKKAIRVRPLTEDAKEHYLVFINGKLLRLEIN